MKPAAAAMSTMQLDETEDKAEEVCSEGEDSDDSFGELLPYVTVLSDSGEGQAQHVISHLIEMVEKMTKAVEERGKEQNKEK